MKQDIEKVCVDCGCQFLFTVGEQEFYEAKRLIPPKRCKECLKEKREREERGK